MGFNKKDYDEKLIQIIALSQGLIEECNCLRFESGTHGVSNRTNHHFSEVKDYLRILQDQINDLSHYIKANKN